MSKLLSNVLEKISENNNEYRVELQKLNKKIDEKTTTLVGDVVTLSKYTIDFSNAITYVKENLVNPINRLIESYVIKDLRSVETVNEQFANKINDKLSNASITTNEEKDKFIDSLNLLLNDKYLEIIRIKRVDFIGLDGTNSELEEIVEKFLVYLGEKIKLDSVALKNTLNSYKAELYDEISKTLAKINELYLNNFVSEIRDSLNNIIDLNDNLLENEIINRPHGLQGNDTVVPFVPEISQIPEIPEVPEIPEIPEMPILENNEETEDLSNNYPSNNEFESEEHVSEINDNINLESTTRFDLSEIENTNNENNMDIPYIPEDIYPPMEDTLVTPIEVQEAEAKPAKKQYDVEEILKIAKSPIININNETPKTDDSLTIKPTQNISKEAQIELEFNEKEIVEEMIRRLTVRLEKINERQADIDELTKNVEEDETFVNDLILSSNNKKEELDNFEKELDEKEAELEQKQIELNKKLNDVLPFANAIMKNEETTE